MQFLLNFLPTVYENKEDPKETRGEGQIPLVEVQSRSKAMNQHVTSTWKAKCIPNYLQDFYLVICSNTTEIFDALLSVCEKNLVILL